MTAIADDRAETTRPGSLLTVTDLRTHFSTRRGVAKSVDGVSFHIGRGETLAVVGESGSGKSVTSLSIMRLLPDEVGRIVSGEILFTRRSGEVIDLVQQSERAMRRLRGDEIAMVFQEPMTSLDPVQSVGDQIAEVLRLHRGASKREAMAQAVELLRLVGIPSPERRAREFPHEMSGGMRQRVMIAMALACRPSLLIADEPTTALDVTIQAQILELIRRLQAEMGMAVLFITHNLGVVAEVADRVVVMYCGRVVEEGDVHAIFAHPRHPYTIALLNSVPRLGAGQEYAAAGKGEYRLEAIPGKMPSASDVISGCAFAPRCKFALPACREAPPLLVDTGTGHMSRCIRWEEL